jgi:hypothetical protein
VPTLGAVTAVPIIATGVLFALATFVSFPFWGRHLAGVLPFVLAGGALALKAERRTLRVAVAAALICCYVYSSFQLRFDPRHAKDDYRTAAALAQRALVDNKQVWWNADTAAARYYGVPLTKSAGNGTAARVFMNPDLLAMSKEPLPDLALLTKADVYDQTGAIRKVLETNDFRVTRELQAFSVWERKAAAAKALH